MLKKREFATFGLAGAGVMLLTTLCSAARQPIVTPFGEELGDAEATNHTVRSSGVGLIPAADHLVDSQCADGGWVWPWGPCTGDPTPFNTASPIALGLLNAYAVSGDGSYLASALFAGDHALAYEYGNGERRFSAGDPWFLFRLSEVANLPHYSLSAEVDFFGALDAGTYGESDIDTAGWITAVQNGRSGVWINLRSWEFSTIAPAAGELGTPAQETAFINAILDGLDTLAQDPNTAYYDLIGIAGAVRGLAMTGTTTFDAIDSPDHTPIDGMTTLGALADWLAGQQNTDGSWYWSSGLTSPVDGDKSTQITAYAILALAAADDAGVGSYTTEIAAGQDWLWSMQDPGDGAFFSWGDGTGKNYELIGEATNAVQTLSPAPASITLETASCNVPGGTMTVAIEMSNAPEVVAGGQFFLEYDTSVLTFDSAVPGDSPFTVEIFESVDTMNGTIDYAVGIPLPGGQGTDVDTTMATLTFTVAAGSDLCLVDDLLKFRWATPPSQLTDEQGDPVSTTFLDMDPVTIDDTDPTITCPDDIVVNADAGTCEKVFDFVHRFDGPVPVASSQLPGFWYPDRYAPQVFQSTMFDGDMRLQHGLRSAGQQANRPFGFSGDFYNYQGRKLDVLIGPGEAVSIDMFVDDDWISGTRAGIWATASDGNLTYPIIEFVVDGDVNGSSFTGFRWWQSYVGWTAGLAMSPDDAWHELEIQLTATEIEFYVDNTLLGSVSNLAADKFINIILQGHNQGAAGEYDIYWDNLDAGPFAPSFDDNCGSPDVTYERSDDPMLTLADPFPVGTTTITWTATDDCGNFAECTQDVTVNAVNELIVDVELEGTGAIGTLTRCITFELWDCGTGTVETVQRDLTFTAGIASAAPVEVPCGFYDCITARDTLHTLRSTAPMLAISGTQYTASFLSTDGHDLVGGNLNDDQWVDILDFGTFVGEFGSFYDGLGGYGTPVSGNTLCGDYTVHADVTGDGLVDASDFQVIQINFLLSHEPNCCGMPGLATGGGEFLGVAPPAGPRLRISVAELEERGWDHMIIADLNGDGWIDQRDVEQFMRGARP